MYVTAYGSSPSVWSYSSLGCGSSAPAIRICPGAQRDLAERHAAEHGAAASPAPASIDVPATRPPAALNARLVDVVLARVRLVAAGRVLDREPERRRLEHLPPPAAAEARAVLVDVRARAGRPASSSFVVRIGERDLARVHRLARDRRPPGSRVSSGSACSAPSVSTRLPPPCTQARSFANHASFSAGGERAASPSRRPRRPERRLNVTAPASPGRRAPQLST